MPFALLAMLLLFIWQFNSFRKLIVILATIPFTLIGVVIALKATGTPFSFMATFGVLALFGIIVNNAVLLLEQIEHGLSEGLARHEALVELESKWFAPLKNALAAGQIRHFYLYAPGKMATLEGDCARTDLWKFWRRNLPRSEN